MNFTSVFRFMVVCAVLGATLPSYAQEYPTKPVRIINPFPPGAANDVLARLLASKLTERWKQSVIVENKTGAAGNIGMDYVAKSVPDGYTLVIGANTMAMVPWLFHKLSFDVLKDFVPVIHIADVPGIITVTPSLPAATLSELIRYAKANPGKLSYASAGSGSPQHIFAEYLNALAGIQTLHVPYKGAAPSYAAVISGEVNLTFGAISSSLPLVKSGKLKALASGSQRRLTLMPDLPTAGEAGVPGLEFGFWYGIFAPANTPKFIVTRLYEESARIFQEPDMRERLIPQGFEIIAGSPESLDMRLRGDLERWGKVIKGAGIRAD
jgi:tripartite-type tricarboxylate transporter receptor subunit TctC